MKAGKRPMSRCDPQMTIKQMLVYEGIPDSTTEKLQIDINTCTVLLNNSQLDLTQAEFKLLLILARSAGKALSREQLMSLVSGRDYCVFDRSIDVHISSLRRKLGDNPRKPQIIKTIRLPKTPGYMFVLQKVEKREMKAGKRPMSRCDPEMEEIFRMFRVTYSLLGEILQEIKRLAAKREEKEKNGEDENN